jgi:hypothetical protein
MTYTFEEPFEQPFDYHDYIINYNSYSIDSRLIGIPRIHYYSDTLIAAVPLKTYFISARMGVLTPSYSMDAIVILDSNDPRYTESYVDALFWGFGNEWNKAASSIQLLDIRMKLDFATKEDLDNLWGVILGLGRYAGESDELYRTRLSTYIRIITSSGTKSNCEAVLDRITGLQGSSDLKSYYPATVVLNWTSPSAVERAAPMASMIAEAMDGMLAAGISWSTSYPWATYNMDMAKAYLEIATYNMDGATTKQRGRIYYATGSMWATIQIPVAYTMQGYQYGRTTVEYKSSAGMFSTGFGTYDIMSSLVDLEPFGQTFSYLQGGYSQKKFRRVYEISGELV